MRHELETKMLKNITYAKLISQLNRYDWSHNFDHFVRVRNLAFMIAKEEGGDLEIIEAACLLFDIARHKEQLGLIKDHAVTGARLAKRILKDIGFNESKIEAVCQVILVHRKSQFNITESLEAKILQDADYLDALGAIDVARVFASCLQSKIYKKTLYNGYQIKKITVKSKDESGIHYILYKLSKDNMKPANFHTKFARAMAVHRYKYVKKFCLEFVKEWQGLI